MTMNSLVCGVVSLALVLATTTPAFAAPEAAAETAPATAAPAEATPEATDEAEALSAQAVEAFEDNRYDESIRLFEEAYAIDHQPNYLFNIGRVYEEKGDLHKAVEYYQRFVGQPAVEIRSREVAVERLRVLREAVDELEREKEAAAEPAPTQPVEAEPSDGEVDDGVASRKKKMRIAGYSLMGVGGGALIIGAVFGGLALGKTRDADDAEFVNDALKLRDDAKTQATAADALYITGGILAGAGLILVLTTLGKPKNSASARRSKNRTAFAPALGPRQMGLGLTHRF